MVLLVGVYWKLALLGSQYVWFDHYDLCQLEIPRLQFLVRSIHRGHFPLWDPHAWSGLPVLGTAQPGCAYPLNLLFAALPWGGPSIPVPALNWLFVAIHLIGAWLFYLLCRDLDVSKPAAVLGATTFACSGYFGSVPWLDIGNGISLTPAVLLFAIRLWQNRRAFESAILLGIVLGLSWLSGHHEIPLLNTYAVLSGTLVLAAYRAVAHRRWDTRLIGCAALALLLGAAISAVQTAPLYEFGHEAKRWVGAQAPIGWDQKVPFAVHRAYSLPWSGLAGLLVPSATAELHTTGFVGFTVMVLAVMGIAFRWHNPAVRIAAFLGGGALVYALGGPTPVQRLLYTVVPLLDKLRTPVRGLFLVAFALSLLAAFGAQTLLEKLPPRRTALTITVCVAIAFVFASWTQPEMYSAVPSYYLAKGLVAAAGMVGLVLWGSRSRYNRKLAGALMIAFGLLEATTVARLRTARFDRQHTVCAADMFEYRDVVERLRTEENPGRTDVDRREIMTNLGDLYGLDDLTAFTAGVPARTLRHELHTARTQALFGVTHRIAKTASSPEDVLIGRFANGVRLFRKPRAMPRSWIVHKALRAANAGDLRSAIQNPDVDLRTTAVMLSTAPELEPCGGAETVSVSYPGTDSVLLSAHLNCRGLVVLSDVNYPGWNAFLDGVPTRIWEAYGSFRAVLAPAGTHRIEMRYEPFAVHLGAVLTALGAMASLILLWMARRHATDASISTAGTGNATGKPEHAHQIREHPIRRLFHTG